MSEWVMQVIVTPVGPTAKDKAEHIIGIITDRFPTRYLKDFDPDGYGGRGDIRFTDRLDRAKRFASYDDVMAYYLTQSRAVPLRHDGRPNRPLTAYSITAVEIKPKPTSGEHGPDTGTNL